MKALNLWKLPLILSAIFLLTSATSPSKETERIDESSKVLTDFSKMKEGISSQLMAECEAVVVIPNMLNAGLGVGAKRGRGIGSIKLADGKWSNPVFITLTGGSIGFQVGVQSVDLVLVFKNKGVLTKVNNDDFTIGGDVSVAAGPVGRNSTASTDHKLDAEIYSYSRSKGAFAGISINGSNLSIDKSANANFYGKAVSSQSIFDTSVSKDKAVEKLRAALSAI